MFSLPIIFFLFLFYLVLLALLFLIIQIQAISYAFEAVGISAQWVFALLLLTLLGSSINIPIKRISQTRKVQKPRRVGLFGWRFPAIPRVERQETLLAVNLGGAVIPTLLSLYLIMTNPSLLGASLISTAIMALVVHQISRPIEGIGIGVPLLIPPVLAALLALVFSASHAPVVAYISGTLGTLIGADLMNFKKITELGAPVASIGGAGTFDGLFLTGIIAVLLASL